MLGILNSKVYEYLGFKINSMMNKTKKSSFRIDIVVYEIVLR